MGTGQGGLHPTGVHLKNGVHDSPLLAQQEPVTMRRETALFGFSPISSFHPSRERAAE